MFATCACKEYSLFAINPIVHIIHIKFVAWVGGRLCVTCRCGPLDVRCSKLGVPQVCMIAGVVAPGTAQML